MRPSTRARYGLRALLYLAEKEPGSAVSVREIAEQENVSADYLEHLLHAMKGAGLVESVRGATGGFRLAKPAGAIALKDIFKALDEKVEPVWCLEKGEACPRSGQCKSRPVWDRLGSLVETFLSDTSLADAVSSGEE
jgi:Rrf2 family protein